MEQKNEFQQAIDAVEDADGAVGHLQANVTPRGMQRAQLQLQLAQEALHQAQSHDMDEEQEKRLKRAKEHLRHLREAQQAIQQYD